MPLPTTGEYIGQKFQEHQELLAEMGVILDMKIPDDARSITEVEPVAV
jgi:hypothetical protein